MKKKIVIAVALVFIVAFALFLNSFTSSPLPAPEIFTGDLPKAYPPAEMTLFALPTGVTHRSAGFAYRGGSFREKRNFSMTAVLVKHPKGDLLIETGFGRNIDAQFKRMPFWFRAISSYQKFKPAAEQLRASGYDFKNLRGVILTHTHWDHVSGLTDFQNVPVWITAEERQFIYKGGFVTAVARSIPNVNYQEYTFESGPYFGFDKSYDFYSDGSIVLVPAPGHTSGSVIIFLALPNGKRYAFVGDLVWQQEGITKREERPWLQRLFADTDGRELQKSLLRMSALVKRFPEIILVPAHDSRGYSSIPLLQN